MTSLGKFETGDPVILVNANDLGKYGFRTGLKGTANAIQNVGDDRYVLFMPNHTREMYWIDSTRFVLDEEAKASQLPIDIPEDLE
tara:strand:- start:2368 stop:2622 length:255 start_codon:yes stop_codon:yes gene_type:complete